MSKETVKRFDEMKTQPWKDFFPSGDASALTESLYGNCVRVSAMERDWSREECRLASDGGTLFEDGSKIATSGAGFGHAGYGSKIATSGAGFGHSENRSNGMIATKGA